MELRKISSYEKGKDALQKGDYEDAVNFFKQAVTDGDNTKDASKMVKNSLEQWGEEVNKNGDVLYKQKNYSEAMKYYKQSIDIMNEAENKKRVENFTKELLKATEKLAQEINNDGDKLMKEKKYEEAIEVYTKSVNLMMDAGHEKKVANFQDELRNAMTKHAQELAHNAINLAKEEKLDEGLENIKQAQDLTKKLNDPDLTKEIEELSSKAYEKTADAINKKGDKEFKDKNWKQAIEYYQKSVDLIKEAKNDKKYENYHKELIKAFTENAEEINSAADNAYKDKDYETAIQIYQQSIDAAKESGNDKLIANFESELEKSFEKYAEEVNSKGDQFYKEKNWMDAEKYYVKSIQLAQNSKKDKLVENFKKELMKTYDKWSKSLMEEGAEILKKEDYKDAIDKYTEAMKIWKIPQDKTKEEEINNIILNLYEKWASKINSEGDKQYKMKDYQKAYDLYNQSVELAQKSMNPKLLKNFRKERDKSLKKLNK